MTASALTWDIAVAWTGQITGAFQLDVSTLDGPDTLAGTFGANVFDDIGADVKHFEVERGRRSDLSAMEKGRAVLTLADPTGKYNPEAATVLIRAETGNGDFETGTLEGWVQVPGDGTIAKETTIVYRGAASAKLTPGALGNTRIYRTFAVTPGQTYTIGGYQYDAGGIGGRYGVYDLSNSADIIATTNCSSIGTSANWTHWPAGLNPVTTFVAPAGCNLIEFRLWGQGGPGSDTYFDDITLIGGVGDTTLAGYLVPMRPLRIRATHLGTTRGVHYGFIERIEHNPVRTVLETIIETVDLLEWLDRAYPTIAATGATTIGAAIGLVLDAIGWTDPAMRSLGTGDSISDFSANGTKSGLTLISELLTADLGVFFLDGDGIATYQPRLTRYAKRAADATLTGSYIQAARPGIDARSIVNRQTVTRTGGVAQTYTDDASRRAYGYRDGTAIASSYLASDTTALNLATFLVKLQADGRPRTRPLGLANKDDTAVGYQLDRELGDLLAISEPVGATNSEGFIEALRHEAMNRFLRTTFLLAKRPVNAFVLDVSTLDGPDLLTY